MTVVAPPAPRVRVGGAPLRRLLPGDRRVWMAAGVAALLLVIVGTVELVRPREYYTGSNSVGGTSAVADVAPGSKLCVGGLIVPAGTGQIAIATASTVPVPALRAELQPVGGPPLTMRSTPQPVGTGKVLMRLPGEPTAATTAARLCVSPQLEHVLVGGVAGIQGDQRAPGSGQYQIATRAPIRWPSSVGAR